MNETWTIESPRRKQAASVTCCDALERAECCEPKQQASCCWPPEATAAGGHSCR